MKKILNYKKSRVRLPLMLRQVTAPCPAWREMLRQELELVDTPDLPLVDLTGAPSAFRCVPSQQALLRGSCSSWIRIIFGT
jgi:hypothetical protein